MALKDQLDADLKASMREKDAANVDSKISGVRGRTERAG